MTEELIKYKLPEMDVHLEGLEVYMLKDLMKSSGKDAASVISELIEKAYSYRV